MKYTPAPWNLRTESLIVRSSDGENYIADCGVSYSLSDDEMKANAILVSAAPELLEALESIMPYIAHDKCVPWEKAQRAIAKAKAKGETP